eukprot:12930219-Prorocentrum_lima.AAC.1
MEPVVEAAPGAICLAGGGLCQGGYGAACAAVGSSAGAAKPSCALLGLQGARLAKWGKEPLHAQ